ncbi:MAG: hypothetical protein ACTSVI_03490 [Promethearchaeota archaeon]
MMANKKTGIKKIFTLGLLLSIIWAQMFMTFFRSFFYTIYPIIHNSVFSGSFTIKNAQIIYVTVLIGGSTLLAIALNRQDMQERMFSTKIKHVTTIITAVLSIITPFIFTINEDLFNLLSLLLFLISILFFIIQLNTILVKDSNTPSLKFSISIGVSIGAIILLALFHLALLTLDILFFTIAALAITSNALTENVFFKEKNNTPRLKNVDVTFQERHQERILKIFIYVLPATFAGFPNVFSNYSILNFEIVFSKAVLENLVLLIAFFSIIGYLSFKKLSLNFNKELFLLLTMSFGFLILGIIFTGELDQVLMLFTGAFCIANILRIACESILDNLIKRWRSGTAFSILFFSSLFTGLALGLNYAKFALLLTIPAFQANDFSTNININTDLFLKIPFMLISAVLILIAIVSLMVELKIISSKLKKNTRPS